ncbi:MAG: hypothetical protein HQ546_07400, partial [Planctomycetes bacterium]|nr:hypothetical protein [Planctomycetota bacterium]
ASLDGEATDPGVGPDQFAEDGQTDQVIESTQPDGQHVLADTTPSAQAVPPREVAETGDAAPSTKLPATDEPLAMVRYGQMNNVELFHHNLDPPPRRASYVIIRTQRGVELGQVVCTICKDPGPNRLGHLCWDRLGQMLDAPTPQLSYDRQNRILRLASPQDINEQAHLDRTGREKIAYCKQQAAEFNLKIRMVWVEHLFGGERVIFYFTAEGRVDFRELVRQLANQYRTRIEMRQIGARDEARLVADYERCGQRCCCQQFLGTLQPVSIRMAKTQKATLDPSKISGRCSRLMCCLRYEDDTYEQLRQDLPRKNTWVRTDDIVGRVIETQTLTQLVKVIDIRGLVTVIDNAAIVERDLPCPVPIDDHGFEQGAKGKDSPRPIRLQQKKQDRTSEPPAAVAESGDQPTPGRSPVASGDLKPAEGQAGQDGGEIGRQRRRRRRPKQGKDSTVQPQASADDGKDSAVQANRPKTKKRRRRRGKPNPNAKAGGESSAQT